MYCLISLLDSVEKYYYFDSVAEAIDFADDIAFPGEEFRVIDQNGNRVAGYVASDENTVFFV